MELLIYFVEIYRNIITILGEAISKECIITGNITRHIFTQYIRDIRLFLTWREN